MTNDPLQARLAELDCFQGVGEADLVQLAKISRLVDFAAGEVLFREGDAATMTYLIVEGMISLEICSPGVGCRRIQTIGKGDLLGWTPVLEGARLTVTALSMGPSQAIEIQGERALELCEQSPRFGYQFMRRVAQTLAHRLSAARIQLLDIYGAETP